MKRDEVAQLLDQIASTYQRFRIEAGTLDQWHKVFETQPALKVWDAWKVWLFENEEAPKAPASLMRHIRATNRPDSQGLSAESQALHDKYHTDRGLVKISFDGEGGRRCYAYRPRSMLACYEGQNARIEAEETNR